jgi:hypothetical protein
MESMPLAWNRRWQSLEITKGLSVVNAFTFNGEVMAVASIPRSIWLPQLGELQRVARRLTLKMATPTRPAAAILAALFILVLPNLVSGADAPEALDSVCAIYGQSVSNNEINEELLRLDDLSSTAQLAIGFEELIQRAGIDYCDVERRLRALNARTYLLAVPMANNGSAVEELTMTYAGRGGYFHPIAPRYSVWFERQGPEAAQRLLDRYGIGAEANLRNLSSAGHLAWASSVHRKLELKNLSEKEAGIGTPFGQLWKILTRYRAAGHLGYLHNVRLMYALESYLSSKDAPKFAINRYAGPEVLSVFVVERDPERLLSRTSLQCNCGHMPNTNLIVCDDELLRALEGWNHYATGGFAGARLLNDLNDEFILNWIIGHEVGHYILGHAFGGRFDAVRDAPSSAFSTPATKRKLEEEADTFAAEHMSGYLIGGLIMSANLLFYQLYDSIGMPPGKPVLARKVIYDSPADHPNMLFRLYSFRRAIGDSAGLELNDSLWDGREEFLISSATSGLRFPTICEMADSFKRLP